jgi:hypothetical protein
VCVRIRLTLTWHFSGSALSAHDSPGYVRALFVVRSSDRTPMYRRRRTVHPTCTTHAVHDAGSHATAKVTEPASTKPTERQGAQRPPETKSARTGRSAGEAYHRQKTGASGASVGSQREQVSGTRQPRAAPQRQPAGAGSKGRGPPYDADDPSSEATSGPHSISPPNRSTKQGSCGFAL